MGRVVGINKYKTDKIQYHTIVAVTIFHVLAVVALFYFSWQNLVAAVVCWWISGSWGIGLGYHRLLTHRGFKSSKPLEYFLSVCGSLALQAGPIAWVTTHRLHHAYTDTDKDPHSPRNGIFWGHMGWIFFGTGQNHGDETHQRYSPDLYKDNVIRAIEKYYWVTSVVIGLILFLIGGWSMVLWGIFLRTVWGWHSTWLVNSATHLWGKQRFDCNDDSTNNGLIAALTFGEGWHNNHHAFPRSARHGLSMMEIDVNWIQIRALEKLGLITDVYAVDLDNLKNDSKTVKKAA
ncbi:MAG: acyl-CoA desaturase [Pyrinomonadaceae bacterium]